MDCEVLFPKIAQRGANMLRAMIEAAPQVGVKCLVTESYQGSTNLLMSYGLGHGERRVKTEAHVASGGRLIGWDMGYWNRTVAMRATIDQGHPQRWLRDMPGDRWDAAGIRLRNDFDPNGPIVLIGMGFKSRAQFGLHGQAWELRTLAAIRAAHPNARVLYRPKHPERLPGCSEARGTIDEALKGAQLVVCRHSNVAVDACIAGIPVVCEDGAAAAIYGTDLASPVNPSEAERRQFLHNLAYFNWQPSEATEAWRFLLAVLASTSVREVAGRKAIGTATCKRTRKRQSR